MGPKINDRNQQGLVTSWVVSLSFPRCLLTAYYRLLVLGAFFASPVAGWSGDVLGRRWAIIVGCITFIIGGVTQTAAMNMQAMMAGRVS